MEKQVIETGVDKLVELLKGKGKISFRDAARELGVGPEVIAEWAEFLNEEGILGIEYRFTTPFLVERKISKGDVEKKSKEFEDKKDLFVRNAEGTLSVLQREAENMKRMQKEFEALKKDLGFNLDLVKQELAELERMEQAKEQISKKLADEKRMAQDKEQELRAMIATERRTYELLKQDIAKEEKSLAGQKSSAEALERREKSLRKEIVGVRNFAREIEEKAQAQDVAIKGSEQHIDRLKQAAEGIRRRMSQGKKSFEPLLKQKEEHEHAMKELQLAIIKKINGKKKGKKDASVRLKGFFEEKMKASMLIEKLNSDRNLLEKDLMDLIRKAKAFRLTAKGKDLEKEVRDIENKFQEMEKRKGAFEEEYKKLGKVIKSK